jgi:hypothetical protein
VNRNGNSVLDLKPWTMGLEPPHCRLCEDLKCYPLFIHYPLDTITRSAAWDVQESANEAASSSC